MRKPAILAFLFIYLCVTTCLGELLKAPVLVSHFIEHRAENTDISFYTFLYQHYQDDDGNDQDNERDSQLPFKSADTCQGLGAGVPMQLTKFRLASFTGTLILSTVNYKEPFIPSPYLCRIWQPPKFFFS